jgi:hypothetical protein
MAVEWWIVLATLGGRALAVQSDEEKKMIGGNTDVDLLLALNSLVGKNVDKQL